MAQPPPPKRAQPWSRKTPSLETIISWNVRAVHHSSVEVHFISLYFTLFHLSYLMRTNSLIAQSTKYLNNDALCLSAWRSIHINTQCTGSHWKSSLNLWEGRVYNFLYLHMQLALQRHNKLVLRHA
jgi:hypothetical protein